MAQRGRSDWERQLAAQRREAERQTREAARQAKEQQKAQQSAHITQQQRLAETKTTAVLEDVKLLDQVLVGVLNQPPITFDDLKVKPRIPPFQPGKLGTPPPAPNWQDYAPVEPHGIDRWFGGMNKYRQDVETARARFAAATVAFQRDEAERTSALAAAQAFRADTGSALDATA